MAGIFPSEAEATVAVSTLRARGIQALLDPRDPCGSAALTRKFESVRVLVRRSDLSAARELLQTAGGRDTRVQDDSQGAILADGRFVDALREIRRRRRQTWSIL